jgi:hypothetical protein
MALPTIYTYPTAHEIGTIEPEKLAVLTMNDPLFDIMPIQNKDSHVVSWEQRDNFTGLQAVRGLNGQPTRVKSVGGKRFTIEPGVYGEFKEIDEQELTTRRQWGTEGSVIDIQDLVLEAQDHLLNRRIDRIRQIGWTLLTKGVFAVASEGGAIMHTDQFPIQRFVVAVAWTTTASSTPLANFRGLKLLGRGRSTSFGSQAKAFMNQKTFNDMIASTNANDIAGRRTTGLNSLIALNQAELNRVFLGEDLPQVVIYDEGWTDEAGAFQLFIPDGYVVVVGTRPAGQPVGEYLMTRNVNNPGEAPGAYTKVVDKAEDVPRSIKVHDGHNGGVALYYPGAIVVMRV